MRTGAARDEVALAAATVSAALGSLACTLVLREAAGLSAQLPVLAVALAITLRRVQHPTARERLVALVELPVVALATGGVGWLVVREPWVGQPLLVVGLCVTIIARRYPPLVRQIGRLVSLPFVSLMIAPAPVVAHGGTTSIWWTPLVALIALAWTTAAHAVLNWCGLSGALPPSPPARGPRRRWDAPTRMALQMVVGLGVALAVGHLLFGAEWGFTVLSAYVVASGNRGRGDVAHKAGLRVFGGAVGTAVATLGAAGLPTGNRGLLVALFVVLFAGLVLRERNYAWWAGSVTAMLALLHAYYGQHGAGVLGDRLLGVLLGSAIALAAAWFVTPVRTTSVFRRYVADALAALTDDLAPGAGTAGPRFAASLRILDGVSPTWRAHRHTTRLPLPRTKPATHPIDAITALHRLVPLPSDPDERRALRTATVRVRRAMVGRDDPALDELPAPLATVHGVLCTVARTAPLATPRT